MSIIKLSLRGLVRRIGELDAEITLIDIRRRRITTELSPDLVAAFGVGPAPRPGCCSPPVTTPTGSAKQRQGVRA
jgi:hypothetical protein